MSLSGFGITEICALVAAIGVCIRLYDGFASKKDTKTAEATLARRIDEKAGDISRNVDQHRIEARKLIEDQTAALRSTMKDNADIAAKAIAAVLEQTQKTNGRVTDLERWKIAKDAAEAALAAQRREVRAERADARSIPIAAGRRNRKAK